MSTGQLRVVRSTGSGIHDSTGVPPHEALRRPTGTLSFSPIILAKKGSPAADVPLEDVTFDPASVKVSRLDVAGWKDVTPSGPAPAEIKYDPGTATLRIVFAADLSNGPLFALAFDPPASMPTVDKDGAPLRPFTRRFKFTLDTSGTALALVQVG